MDSDLGNGLLKLLSGLGGLEPASLTRQLAEFLKSEFKASRYLCLYYNVATKTHVEFNLLPPDLHVPAPEPQNRQCCFRERSVLEKCKLDDGCGSNRCNPKTGKVWAEHDSSRKEAIRKRWWEGREDFEPHSFWLDYELFLHRKFDPFEEHAHYDSVVNTALFNVLNNKACGTDSVGEFFQNYGIFRGDDSWFSADGKFKLETFNTRNELATKFYGCYLIPPRVDEKHAAILLAYVDEHYTTKSEGDEVSCASKLLGFLSQVCWPTLNREISADLARLHASQATVSQQAAIYGRIKDDLQSLAAQVTKLRSTTLRIEEELSPVRDTFLLHGPNFELVFKTDLTLYYSSNQKTHPGVDRLQKDGYRQLRTVHNHEAIGNNTTLWTDKNGSYSDFLKCYADAHNLEMLKAIAEVKDAEMGFMWLKRMFHRPHKDPMVLFGAQVALAMRMASNDLVVVLDAQTFPRLINLSTFIGPKDIRYQLGAGGSCPAVLSALLRVADTLKTAGGNDKSSEPRVGLTRVEIVCSPECLRIVMDCVNQFRNPVVDLYMRDEAKHHDTAGAFHFLLRAIGSDGAPLFLERTLTEALKTPPNTRSPTVAVTSYATDGEPRTAIVISIPPETSVRAS